MKGRSGIGGHPGVLLRHPALLWEAVRAAWAIRRRGQVMPSAIYLEWRIYTAYGDPKARVPIIDLVHYLRWRRDMRKVRRGRLAT